MLQTPLHRALGEAPGPLTDQMIDDAVAQGVVESDELDWKAALPSQKDLRDSDIVKDIAAFANASGGIIIFGVTEKDKAATGRQDAGELTEGYERTVRQVSMSAITPPVFGIQAIEIPSAAGTRAVALLIPASPDSPHLVYRNDLFGAPLRVGADTHWMKERDVEAAYRSRFEGARRGEQALQDLYDDLAAAADPTGRAVLVGTARPRARRLRSEQNASSTALAHQASLVNRWWLGGTQYGPLEDLELYQPSPTLNGEYLRPATRGDYREAHAVVLNDGSVGLSWRAGAHQHEVTGKRYDPHQVPALALSAFAASLVALIHAVAGDNPAGDYDILFGLELDDDGAPPEIHERDAAPPSGVHRTLSGRFRPIRMTVDPSVADTEFIQAAIDLATLAVNQVGIKKPTRLDTMLAQRPRNWTW